ncbi:GNAT family N-acetyltransferase [Pseudoruegeria sp. HB172150]|uniref:GNAT family N-acetyltransferase n=1 Tax=Pseudoruegeria sp. HB172150 TaxID=2721164 RepID=UPI0015544D24|nr:GNAT family N-acetyltransferase [Pseudoruegeria sp. HB172150]
MQIDREEGETKGEYTAEGGAYMTYSVAGPSMIIIDHTEVPESLKGQGVGLALVSRAVEDARKEGRTIVPLCPYANAQFRRHKEWRDVWNGAPKS